MDCAICLTSFALGFLHMDTLALILLHYDRGLQVTACASAHTQEAGTVSSPPKDGQKTLYIAFGIGLPHAQTVLGVDLSKLVVIGFTGDKVMVNTICITNTIPLPAGRVQHMLSKEI